MGAISLASLLRVGPVGAVAVLLIAVVLFYERKLDIADDDIEARVETRVSVVNQYNADLRATLRSEQGELRACRAELRQHADSVSAEIERLRADVVRERQARVAAQQQAALYEEQYTKSAEALSAEGRAIRIALMREEISGDPSQQCARGDFPSPARSALSGMWSESQRVGGFDDSADHSDSDGHNHGAPTTPEDAEDSGNP